jgi:hypothetical protein
MAHLNSSLLTDLAAPTQTTKPTANPGFNGALIIQEASDRETIWRWNGTLWKAVSGNAIRGSADPTNAVTPDYQGQEFWDSTADKKYYADGTTSADWKAAGSSSGGGGGGGSTGSTLNQGLVGVWRLNNLEDAIGLASLRNTNNNVTFKPGRVGLAAFFQRSQYAILQADTNVPYTRIATPNIDWTFSCWVKLNSIPSSGSPMTAVSKEHYTGIDWYLQYNHQESRFEFAIGSETAVAAYVNGTNFGAAQAQTWYPVRVWNDVTLNRAGLQIGGSTPNYEVHNGTAFAKDGTYMNFGASVAYGAEAFWDGGIDAAHQWDRLLTDSEWTEFMTGVEYPFI